MKSVLLSIKPKFCELIASGEKTVEIRKNCPKIDVPFKCYIYCTRNELKIYGDGKYYVTDNSNILNEEAQKGFEKTSGMRKWNGKVIGEFVCDRIDKYEAEFTEDNECYQDIRLIWKDTDYDCEAEEDYLIVTSNERDNPNDCILCKESCLSFEEIKQYIGICFGENFYAWHISDLVIYDKPKELSEFLKYNRTEDKCYYQHLRKPNSCRECMRCALERPPQIWCYVEELEETI